MKVAVTSWRHIEQVLITVSLSTVGVTNKNLYSHSPKHNKLISRNI